MSWSGCPRFGAHLRASARSRSTRTTYLSYLQRFAREYAWLSPWAVTPDHVAVCLSRLPSVQYGRRAAGSLRLDTPGGSRRSACRVAGCGGGAVAAARGGPGGSGGPGPVPRAVNRARGRVSCSPARGPAARSERRRLPDPSRGLAGLERDPWTVTTARLVEWLAGWELRPASRKSVRTALRSFYGWAARTGRWGLPGRGAGRRVDPASIPRPVTDDALTAALGAADDKSAVEAHRRPSASSAVTSFHRSEDSLDCPLYSSAVDTTCLTSAM